MTRYVGTIAVLLVLSGCWMFERVDDRPAPIVEAAQNAVTAFDGAAEATPAIPIPGLPTWILPLVVGAAAGLGAFIHKLVARGSEEKKTDEVPG